MLRDYRSEVTQSLNDEAKAAENCPVFRLIAMMTTT
jgi:hypothetical protein